MKVQSTVMPNAAFEIEKINEEYCDVVLFKNVKSIEKKEDEEEVMYEYDMYRVTTIYREELSEILTEKYNEWIEFAERKELETL